MTNRKYSDPTIWDISIDWDDNPDGAEIEQLTQALGLLTTLHPTMEIDVRNPLKMARKIEAHIRTEIYRLRKEWDAVNGLMRKAQRDHESCEQARANDRAEIERLKEENERWKPLMPTRNGKPVPVCPVCGQETSKVTYGEATLLRAQNKRIAELEAEIERLTRECEDERKRTAQILLTLDRREGEIFRLNGLLQKGE